MSESPKKQLRSSLGLPEDAPIALVIFENQTQQALRFHWRAINDAYHCLLIYPVSPLARKHLMTIFRPVLDPRRHHIVDTLDVEPACDDVIMFRYVEELMAGRKIPVRIADNGRWLSGELA